MATRIESSADTRSGWAALFWQAFTCSRNGMLLVDDHRQIVEVNGALLQLLGYTQGQLVSRALQTVIADGPLLSADEWRTVLARPHTSGVVELVTARGERIMTEFAAHPETVTGRRLLLAVVMVAGRPRRLTLESTGPPAVSAMLTAREREVIHQVALGHSGPEIAAELHLSHNTVRTHINNAMTKLGARSRAQLVAIVLGDGHTAA